MSLLDTASLVVTPNGTKASKLYSVVPSSGAGDLNVTRATTATRVNSSGLIESVASNVPRLDYTNGSCPSILVEPQRTNLALYSEDFTNGSWIKIGTSFTVTANTTISPDGNLTADTLNVGNNDNVLYQSRTGVFSGNTFVFTIYAKGTGTFSMNIRLNSSTTTTQIKTLSSQWQKFEVIVTNSVPVVSVETYLLLNTSSTYNIWGAQLEEGSYATSYIPTTSASVTRNADVISKTGISSLIGQTEGTMFLDFNFNYSDSTTQVLLKVNQSNDSNSVGIEVQNNSLIALVNSSGSNIATLTNTISTGRIKCAIAYKSNDMVFYVNGVQVGIDTGGTINFGGNVDMLTLGHFNLLGSLFFQSSRPFNSASIWKTRLTNTQLASLTTI